MNEGRVDPNGEPIVNPPEPEDDQAPPFSEEQLAQSFAQRHAHELRYVAKWGKWFAWTGCRWREDDTLNFYSLARRICREAANACNKPSWKKAIASAKTVAAVEKLARADRRLAANIEQWDADPWSLNTPDGVVDLRTGKLRPHDSSDYMTKITTVGPGGDCPRFKLFMNEIMNGDKEMVAFIKRVLGYCLTGDTSEEVIIFLYGVGQNGKGTLLSTVEWIMADYYKSAGDEVFTETKNDRHSTEIARLVGARAVLVSEVEQGRHWAEARLKKMTGGDTVTAHFMRQDDFEYKPQFKPLISGNHKPQLKSVGVAMRRRLHLLPFSVVIADEKRDRGLKERLKGEGPGILKWMIEGCLEYQKIGLAPPASVTEATDTYFRSEDAISNWIAEWCEIGPNFFEGATRLFRSWRHYAETNKLVSGNNKKFREEMEDRLGYTKKHMYFGEAYLGLQIRSDAPEPSDGDPGPANERRDEMQY